MEQKKGIIILMGVKFSFSIVQSSRALYIFKELKEQFPDTYIIMRKNEEEKIELENLIQIKPIIPISKRFQLLKGMVVTLQITLLSLWHIVSKRVDYVIVRGYDTILLYPFLKILNIKIYTDYHGKYKNELDQQNRHLRALFVGHIERLSLYLADRIIVVSGGVITQIQEYEHKCIYLPNGIDIHTINGNDQACSIKLPGNKKIIGFIGNWEQFMKIEDVCECLKYANNCIGVIIGMGYKADHIMNKYSDTENIIFTGRLQREDVYALLHKFDICILPYDKDDKHSLYPDYFSSRKAKEYIAAGKPIVVSDVEGRESWLIENQNCLLYESGNPKDLAEKIDILLNNEELYDKMCTNNRDLSKNFMWDTIIYQSGLIDDIRGNI
ncbi:glycosyltransferase family 4 protein [Methanococcoides alaskense]|uniref:Glycosyltransferase involved in cell wall biosynthesis n=1 Tax=Methanococcoides alaskense TaxID=325778 RepID=A0AA90TYM4_9EURY|nr:glycosyltransferase family 4 protein [Methanococcoides alaskense]MDA0524652.1 glycosyltransferase family 4 protein [Methanococcoides alaskense]MDR6222422.1 glycosyltransferase involved in cell wall biosynthesis [Methanococcoides alaskense]